jgi:hypothetical protein
MSEKNNLSELQGYIEKQLQHIDKVNEFYTDWKNDSGQLRKKRNYDLIVLAEIFTDFYTSTETAFVRISKQFENNLDSTRWHSHLLEKMVIEIPGIRKRVISDTAFSLLLEFMKFRHFRRYYFEFEYDRDRMEYLEKKFTTLVPCIKKELQEYMVFLNELKDRM